MKKRKKRRRTMKSFQFEWSYESMWKRRKRRSCDWSGVDKTGNNVN